MTCKFIGNELLVIDLIPLTYMEKKLIRVFQTFDMLSMDEICIVTKTNPIRTKEIIKNLNKKTNFFFIITKTSGFKRFNMYYLYVRKKEKGYGLG